MNLKDLSAPFPADKVHWRVGSTTQDKKKGLALAYLDARDVMERLDEVCETGWQCDYPFVGCCRIGLLIDSEWVWRANGAGETDVEGAKGQYSDAFKRAAVLWGIGRYLYDLENIWCPIEKAGNSYKLSKTPSLPAWALPGGKATMTFDDKEFDRMRNAFAESLKSGDRTAAEIIANLRKQDYTLSKKMVESIQGLEYEVNARQDNQTQ